jgi:hypothetical protein
MQADWFSFLRPKSGSTFRKLVKILVKRLGVRVEMRQVGIRNQAKMCGGIGRCGREICCSKFIEKFETVSIRMAKSQSLSLNPTKISGLCGRLMCCLNYEFETYRDLQKKFPKIGKKIADAGRAGQGRPPQCSGQKTGRTTGRRTGNGIPARRYPEDERRPTDSACSRKRALRSSSLSVL